MNGHLQPRGVNTWRWHYSIDGQRRPPITLHGTRKEAERQAAILYAQALQGRRTVAPARWTLGDLLRAWLADVAPTLPTARSRELYRYEVEHYWLPAVGRVPLAAYSSRDLLPVKAAWLARGLAASTIRQLWTRLLQAERWAVRHRYLAQTEAGQVDLPAPAPALRQRYSLEAALRLDAELRPPHGIAVALGLWAGLRIGEARGFRKGDIDAAGGVLHVRKQLRSVRGQRGAQLLPPKHGSVRDVEISALLERHLVAQLEHIKALPFQRFDDVLCVGPFGGHVPDRIIRYALWQAQVAAGVERLEFHSLRHTYATLMREAGVPDLDIAASLGHRTTSMLVQLYGNHPDAGRHARVARQLEALVASRSEGLEAQ